MRRKVGTSVGDLEVKLVDDRLVITQARAYDRNGGRYIVSMTVDEARAVVDNLTKRIALLDELQRTGLA